MIKKWFFKTLTLIESGLIAWNKSLLGRTVRELRVELLIAAIFLFVCLIPIVKAVDYLVVLRMERRMSEHLEVQKLKAEVQRLGAAVMRHDEKIRRMKR